MYVPNGESGRADFFINWGESGDISLNKAKRNEKILFELIKVLLSIANGVHMASFDFSVRKLFRFCMNSLFPSRLKVIIIGSKVWIFKFLINNNLTLASRYPCLGISLVSSSSCFPDSVLGPLEFYLSNKRVNFLTFFEGTSSSGIKRLYLKPISILFS